ncbi:hypothetical protein BH09MYX1_BH09MYX1_55350 [soil metagenome]
MSLAPEHVALLPLLPEDRVGAVASIETITMGLSGAAVVAVTTTRGELVLRVRGREVSADDFAQQLRILRRASAAGIAPEIVHVDVAARAVVSLRIAGMPITAALANPTQREAALGSVVDRLRALHALDPSSISDRDPVPFARNAWIAVREQPGFPPWADELTGVFDAIAERLVVDSRRVVSHNDVNPANVMWDGDRAWLIDWEVAGLGHPYYDLATLSLFLRLDDATAIALVAKHDGVDALHPSSRATFRDLRLLAGLLSGFTFLGLAKDLTVREAKTIEDAPTLGDCYSALRTGQLDMRSSHGSVSMGLALLREALTKPLG